MMLMRYIASDALNLRFNSTYTKHSSKDFFIQLAIKIIILS